MKLRICLLLGLVLFLENLTAAEYPFGVHWNMQNYKRENREAIVQQIAEGGAKWIRFDFSQPNIEPNKKGEFVWGRHDYDQCVNLCVKYKIDVIATIDFSSGWANVRGNNRWPSPTYPQTNVQDFADFTRTVVARYKDRIKYWEIWNEADLNHFFKGTPGQYTELLKVAYKTAKETDPGCKVICTGIAVPERNNNLFYKTILKNDAGKYCDFAGFHTDARSFEPRLNMMEKAMSENNVRKDYFITEFGGGKEDFATPEIYAEKYITKYVEILSKSMVKVICAAEWASPDSQYDHESHINTNFTPRPAFYIYQTMTKKLGTAEYKGKIDRKESECYVFINDGKPVLVLWSKENNKTMELQVGSSKIKLTSYDGKMREQDTKDGVIQLELDKKPVYLEGAKKEIITAQESRHQETN